jgi:undecaprenyl-diphosphatase
MTVFDGLLLGTVQGLTEFLPVSSSGHLILLRELLGVNTSGGLAFDAVLQLGTMLAVFVYFRSDILKLIRDTLRLVFARGRGVQMTDKSLIGALIVGTIPALVFGLLLEDVMDHAFRNPLLVALSLLVGSALFMLAEHLARRAHEHVSVTDGIWIGLFQCLALVPGMSRSGSTISGGLFRGLTRESAARFSFLLSIPIITGSGLKKLLDLIQDPPTDLTYLPLILGSCAAFVVGLGCIHILISYLKRHTLHVFAWYRIALAFLVLFVMTH